MGNFCNPPITRTAHKPHRCSYCGEPILAREIYTWQTGNWDGAWFTSKMHPECFTELCDSGDEEYIPYCNDKPAIEAAHGIKEETK